MTIDWLIQQELRCIRAIHAGMIDLLGAASGEAAGGGSDSLYKDNVRKQDLGNNRMRKHSTLSFATLLKAGPGKAEAMLKQAMRGR